MKERITLTLDSEILLKVDDRIDKIKIKNRSHAVELLLVQSLGNHMPQTALILAGGPGTRMRPITHEIPKPLLPVHDRPVLEHNMDLFKKYGIKNIILAIGYKGEKIKEAFGNGKKFEMRIVKTMHDEHNGIYLLMGEISYYMRRLVKNWLIR